MAWRKLDAGEVDEAIEAGVVMLDFFQDACAPCHVLEPRLEAFAHWHRGELTVYRIDGNGQIESEIGDHCANPADRKGEVRGQRELAKAG